MLRTSNIIQAINNPGFSLRPGLFLFLFFTLFATAAIPASAATKLYLRNTNASVSPAGKNMTFGKGAAVVTYTKNTVNGPVTPPTAVTQLSSVATGGSVVTWYSDPLEAVTISSVSFNIWARENNTAGNATITAELLRADNSGSILSTLASVLIPRARLTTTLRAQNWGIIPTATPLIKGDRLAVRFHMDDGNGYTMVTGYNITATLDGATANASGDSWIQVVENLTPASPVVSDVSAVYTSSISAAWGLISGATGYTLAASTKATNPPSPIYASSTTLSATLSSASVFNPALNADTTYYLFARANFPGASSAWAAYNSTVTLVPPVEINEIYPTGTAAQDWVELYNPSKSTFSLTGWKLNYIQNSITAGGTPVTIWTGITGNTINAQSTFTISGFATNLDSAQSYHLRLQGVSDHTIDQVQWPGGGALSSGESFARISDGSDFFEIDPTPTKNYVNYRATDTFKINEVAYNDLGGQFIEIYNNSLTSTYTLTGYSLRNSTGARFKFTRKIFPKNYTVIDNSSISDDALPFANIFGAAGLNKDGDFLALENSTGTTVDMVEWEGATYSRYNYQAQLVTSGDFAPGNSATSIGRKPTDGYDTDDDSVDFGATTFTTIASRNNNAGTAAANTLAFPDDLMSMPKKFPIALTLGAISSSYTANNLLFQRTGGAADSESPHIYRLQDIGINLGRLTAQTTAQVGNAFRDQDGYPLVSSTVYRLILNSDTGSLSAPQIILGTVTYDASVHLITAYNAAPVKINDGTRASALRLDVSNNSPAGFNSVELTTVTFMLYNSAMSAVLTQAQARAYFEAIMVARDASSGLAGEYEPAIDISTIAYVPMNSIIVTAGVVSLNVPSLYTANALVVADSTATFYVVFESTRNASTKTTIADKTYRVRFQPPKTATGTIINDFPSDYSQFPSAGLQLDSSSSTFMAPALPPAGTAWPYSPPGQTTISAPVGYYTYSGDTSPQISSAVYTGYGDGYVRAIKKDGTLKWNYQTAPNSAVLTSPMPIVEGGNLFIYFAAANGDIYKVQDNNTGASETPNGWKISLGVPVRSNLMCSDLSCTESKLYFGTDDNTVRCLNMSDGSACSGWTANPGITAPISGTMVIDNRATINTAWVGLEDGNVVSFKTGDGSGGTSYSTGGAIKSSPNLNAGYGGANNNIYVTSTDGKLYALNAATLAPAWGTAYNSGSAIYSSPMVTWGLTPQTVFFGDDAGRLRSVNAATGALIRTFQAGAAIRSSPVWVPGNTFTGLAQGYVYFGADDGYIYAITDNAGALRASWPVSVGGAVRADMIIDLDSKSLIVGANDGKTYNLYIGP